MLSRRLKIFFMAQTQRRMLYSKIWSSVQFGSLSDKAKLLFIGTITLADDDGILIGSPSYLRGQIFPYDEIISVTEVLRIRDEVEKNGLFSTYSVSGVDYIEHPKWEEYQKIRSDLYKKSSLPKRNGTVTKPLLKSSLSKDKISKDNNTSKEVKGGIKNNKKKMFKSYNEDDHYEEKTIDLETGEVNLPPKKEKGKISNSKHLAFAREYIKYRKFEYKNEKDYQEAVWRYMKPSAALLRSHTGPEILDCMKWCAEKYKEWSLETVVKKIDEYKTYSK